jgi:predicted GIY-YIG superfamily endonuclease
MADMKIKSYKGATRDLTSLFKKHKSGKIEA